MPARSGIGAALGARVPSLLNSPGLTSIDGIAVAAPFFNDNSPQRGDPPLVNAVAGAIEIQEAIANSMWVTETGAGAAYAEYLRLRPLGGTAPRGVLVQMHRGDRTVPNYSSCALIRAGELEDVTTYFRADLAFAGDAALPTDPHAFLAPVARGTDVAVNGTTLTLNAHVLPFAQEEQAQIAAFLASDGVTIVDPDGGTGPIFETPVPLPLPERNAFYP